MAKIRGAGKDADQGGNAGESTPKLAAKVAKATAAGKRKPSGGQKRVARTPSPGEGEDEVGAAPTPPPSGRPKRGAKRDYAQLAGERGDDNDEDTRKKVKDEASEDVEHELSIETDEAAELDGAGFFT